MGVRRHKYHLLLLTLMDSGVHIRRLLPVSLLLLLLLLVGMVLIFLGGSSSRCNGRTPLTHPSVRDSWALLSPLQREALPICQYIIGLQLILLTMVQRCVVMQCQGWRGVHEMVMMMGVVVMVVEVMQMGLIHSLRVLPQ